MLYLSTQLLNRLLASLLPMVCAFLLCQSVHARQAEAPSFTAEAIQRTYFALDSEGGLKLNDKGLPYPATKDIITINTTFSTDNTAFFVIDPWIDMPSEFMNHYFGNITRHYLLPLITSAAEKGFPVYVFTNNCKQSLPVPVSCDIPNELHALIKKFPNAHLVYWQNLDLTPFVKSLHDNGISKIIYTGFASNVCVIGRPAGMIRMAGEGFSNYFIPEASAALETKGTWKSQKIHKATTTIISQSMAKLIHYEDIYKKLQSMKKELS
ncbi:isochorismatase family protein [Legionella geestiana]|uniref:isochorismatase family protein n=1 Tax=Legionella geestiana TaxID=45065 RepID=UPI001091D4B2|nr:isochorismatase family protein [Legionella geestiana]QDQ40015.1 isochorismatase family protein [Legionella geestiana]